MQGQALTTFFLILLILAADRYILRGLQTAFKKKKFIHKRWFLTAYWLGDIILIAGLLLSIYTRASVGVRAAFLFGFCIITMFKVFYIVFIAIDDLRRFITYSIRKSRADKQQAATGERPKVEPIPRSEFLMKAGILAGVVPLVAIKQTMSRGLYDYHVKNVNLYLPNLPKKFDGLRLGQISDIHSGSFYNKTAVKGGIDMLLNQKCDLIFFTGDLVNGATNEVYEYQDTFSKVKAPLGVFSILGNHDYGDYGKWSSAAAKEKNLRDMHTTHKNLGWDLLTDEHRRLKVDGEEIGILGIGNWGELSIFPKYGNMAKAVKDTDDLPVKLLLSHDPSHWRAEVLPKYPQIDVMFSGHTHGMQFGVQTKDFQWSPIQYVYSEWAGLYHEANQQIYVNVGYGFLGYPGRIGILPEITVFTLRAGTDPALKA